MNPILIPVIFGFGLGLSAGYLVSTGIVALIMYLLEIGGVVIDFNVWIGGLIFYILWFIFFKK